MAARMTLTPEQARALEGESLGTTEWRRTGLSAPGSPAATGDRQWIHTDPGRAAVESPFRTTIAHGYFTLGLVPGFLFELLEVTGCRMVINFGAEQVRWPAPVPLPARVRMHASVARVERTARSFTLHLATTIQVEGQAKPAMSATVLFRYYA